MRVALEGDDELDEARRRWERQNLLRSLAEHREFFKTRLAEIDQAIATLGRKDRVDAPHGEDAELVRELTEIRDQHLAMAAEAGAVLTLLLTPDDEGEAR